MTLRDSDFKRPGAAIIGNGAIGSQVAEFLPSQLPALELTGVLDPFAPHSDLPAASLDQLLERSPEIVVEAATHEALAEAGPLILESGIDLLVVSVGALSDVELLAQITASSQKPGSGRFFISTGAVGGIDILRAAKLAGRLKRVEIISTKPAQNLIQPWMDSDLKDALKNSQEPVTAFSGPAGEAARLFPQSANVCAAVGLAGMGLAETKASLIGDPNTKMVQHLIRVSSSVGEYEISLRNQPSKQNPRTSQIVVFSVLRGLKDWAELRSARDSKDAGNEAGTDEPYRFI